MKSSSLRDGEWDGRLSGQRKVNMVAANGVSELDAEVLVCEDMRLPERAM